MLCDVLSKPQYILSNAFLSFLHNVFSDGSQQLCCIYGT